MCEWGTTWKQGAERVHAAPPKSGAKAQAQAQDSSATKAAAPARLGSAIPACAAPRHSRAPEAPHRLLGATSYDAQRRRRPENAFCTTFRPTARDAT